jgi:hypothetical protein
MTFSDVPVACPKCGVGYIVRDVCEETATNETVTCDHCDCKFTILEGNQLAGA